MLVDAEVGMILRLASRLRGEECDSFEGLDTSLGETFPEDTLTLDLPGVRFDGVDRLT